MRRQPFFLLRNNYKKMLKLFDCTYNVWNDKEIHRVKQELFRSDRNKEPRKQVHNSAQRQVIYFTFRPRHRSYHLGNWVNFLTKEQNLYIFKCPSFPNYCLLLLVILVSWISSHWSRSFGIDTKAKRDNVNGKKRI